MGAFRSFFMGGYECADHINRSGDRVNLLAETEHDKRAAEDYALLAPTGIQTVREGICWSCVEKEPYVYDFREMKQRILAAKENNIQQVWDLCHFGYPDDLVPTHPKFAARFSAMCEMFAVYYKELTDEPLIITPVNEISFLSWHSGDVRGTVPFAINSGFDIKYHLCKAAIEGIKALRKIDPECRILLTEPIIKIHAPSNCADENKICEMDAHQFQAMDIIGGFMCPELGGSPEYLDILGFNYYHNNQWEHNSNSLCWPDQRDRRTPLHALLLDAWERYKRPMVLSETGHFGEGRAQWLEEITKECILAMQQGIDLQGICIYPLIDRPDWDNLQQYSNCGLWDLDVKKDRVLHIPYFEMLMQCTQLVAAEKEKQENKLNVQVSY
jgi:beta-glucosidase/6-phospho-beta-glucosidase/beta-galactosidase